VRCTTEEHPIKRNHPCPFILVFTTVPRILVAATSDYTVHKLNHMYSICPACHRPSSAIRSSGYAGGVLQKRIHQRETIHDLSFWCSLQFPVYWWRQPVITRSTSLTICIRFAQHATDLVAPFAALGMRAVYHIRASNKEKPSMTFHSGVHYSSPYVGGANQ
jgi:hypothetical protein